MLSVEIYYLVFIGQPPDSCGHFCCKDDEQENKELQRWRK